MNQTERLYKIDRLLRTQRCVPVDRFIEELGVSIATFKRDLEHLRSRLNAPIEWDRACGGYRLADAATGPTYQLPGVWFNATEIHALLSIEHLLKDIEPGVLQPQFSALRERLAGILGKPSGSAGEIERRIFIRHRFKRPVAPRHFEVVVDALLSRRRLRIAHDSRFTGAATERDVSPQRLIHYREVWYLVACCHLRYAVRTFALDNIRNASVLSETAVEADAGELDTLLDSGYGIWAGKNPRWATLRFHPASARWAASETWHRDQRDRWEADGAYVLEIPYTQDDELVMDVLKYGAGCEVLAPDALRAKVAERLQEALNQYGK